MKAEALLTCLDARPTQGELRAAFALLTPGAHGVVGVPFVLSTRVAVALEDAGFEVRDRLTHVTAPVAPRLDWWLIRKPFKGSVAESVRSHGTGALNIGACRISIAPADDIHAKNPHTQSGFGRDSSPVYGKSASTSLYDPTQGRWPSHLLLSHAPGCTGGGCGKGCPVRRLDEQSGERPAGRFSGSQAKGLGYRGATAEADGRPSRSVGDAGGASRYFQTFGAGNDVALLTYFLRLITPPGGRVFDPFGGSLVRQVLERLGYRAAAASGPG